MTGGFPLNEFVIRSLDFATLYHCSKNRKTCHWYTPMCP